MWKGNGGLNTQNPPVYATGGVNVLL